MLQEVPRFSADRARSSASLPGHCGFCHGCHALASCAKSSLQLLPRAQSLLVMRTCFADPDVTCATSYSQGSIGAEILGSSALRKYKMDLYMASDFSIASDSMEKAENVFERSPDSSNALRVASSGSHDPGATVVGHVHAE